MEHLNIEAMTPDSWSDVARIYEYGISTKNATFEKQAPDWKSWDKTHRKECRLIAMIGQDIVGWAALASVSGRSVYAGIAEVSIYVDAGYTGKKIGDKLMRSLIIESENFGFWSLQAGIFPENVGSIKLHLKHGFRIVGIKEKIGKMDDKWRDVTLLERRSRVVGVD